MTTPAQMPRQRAYRRRKVGITSAPWPCLVRECHVWPHIVFGVVMLVTGRREDLVVEWLVRDVSEAEARQVLEATK